MGKAIRYDESFKKEAVRMYLQSDLSATAIAKQLGIDRHNFYRWIKEFNHGVVVSPIIMCDNLPLFKPLPHQTSKNNKKQDYLDLQAVQDKILELEREIVKLKTE